MTSIDSGAIQNKLSNTMDQYTIDARTPDFTLLADMHKVQSDWSSYRQKITEKYINPLVNTHSKDQLISIFFSYVGEDQHWEWDNKVLYTMNNSQEYDWFILKCSTSNIVQGILVAYHPKKSLIESGDIFYIDYLATAPWNRDTPSDGKKYSGIGTTLIKAVANHYSTMGYKPGFMLHSLPKAQTYYLKLGMKDLGQDPNKNDLHIFEIDCSGCSQLMAR